MNPLDFVLEKARWAPSGDNVQTWRFEKTADDTLIIHAFDTRESVVYDFDGRPSQIALGALLENISIAASHQQRQAEFTRIDAQKDTNNSTAITYQVKLLPSDTSTPDPLVDMIERRSVQRRALSTSDIGVHDEYMLERSVGDDFTVHWLTGLQGKLHMASLLWQNAGIRLTMPEAYSTHKKVIEWGAKFSRDRIPDQAVGMDRLGLLLMRWAMQSWQRVDFMNRYLAGTWLPRIQLDLVPALFCGAHFMLVAKKAPETVEDFISAGRNLQRFWLTATQLGIQLQPEMTPLIFNWYVQAGRSCSNTAHVWPAMQNLQKKLVQICGSTEVSNACFMGRIGYGKPASARSLRLSVEELLISGNQVEQH